MSQHNQRDRIRGYRTITAIASLVILAMAIAVNGVENPSRETDLWIDESFHQFAKGKLDAGGQNLYVSHDGSIRTIHRFDLNQDGYIDLLFNSTHDTRTDLPATLATVDAEGNIAHVPLNIGGSLQVAVGDLNGDGHADAVFCPNRGGVQQARQFVTIAWGGRDGWSSTRVTRSLPVHQARRVAIADLNADGWPDIVVLNGPGWQHGQPEGNILRVFWGSRDGFLLTERTDYGVADAVDMTAADLNEDGVADIVLLGKSSVEILWASSGDSSPPKLERSSIHLPDHEATCLTIADTDGDSYLDLLIGTRQDTLVRVPGASGTDFGTTEAITAYPATHLAAGDLDDDGYIDLVFTNLTSGRAAGGEAAAANRSEDQGLVVLWGDAEGFASERSTQISVAHVAATAIGDVNGDGKPDIAAAVYQGEETFTSESVILLGQGSRRFKQTQQELTTIGATDVAIVSGEGEIPTRVLFCNSVGGTLREEVPLQIYWGGEDGFDVERQTVIPFTSGYEATAADFNADGYVDLVALNSGHSGLLSLRDPTLGINIFWGSAEGFDFEGPRTVLREENLGTSNTADLNRDGYLDLVVGQFSASSDASEAELIVYYGGEDGFNSNRRVAIPSPGRSIGTVIADFNRDEWLDVAVCAYTEDCVRIFWGGPDGFSSDRTSEVRVHSAIDLDTADFNGDGWPDLVVGSYADGVTHEHDLGSQILWGSAEGFNHANAQWLPGLTPIGHCIADFDGDGYLDLFSPNYHATGMRESIPSYLFWGSADGFDPTRRTDLTCDSADDALAADFDRDGRLDLAVVCHGRDGSHHTVSKVFYNDGNRFQSPRVQTLPTHGPHWMWHEDMGHIHHRRWEQRYESSVHEFAEPRRLGRLEFKAELPEGTRLAWQIRSAANSEELARQEWIALDPAGSFELDPADRVVQYAANFLSDNGDRYPVLNRVQITLAE